MVLKICLRKKRCAHANAHLVALDSSSKPGSKVPTCSSHCCCKTLTEQGIQALDRPARLVQLATQKWDGQFTSCGCPSAVSADLHMAATPVPIAIEQLLHAYRGVF